MRILWHSVAPWIKTGYGSQTEIFTKRIRDLLGHEVAISTWAMRGGMMDYDGMPVYPGYKDNFGNDIVASHAKHWNADLVITLTDSWVFKVDSMKKIPWLAWTPVDHDPVPPKVINTLRYGYAVPVAYSRFGERKLAESGLSPLYVPHAIHEDYLKTTTQRAARKRLGFPQDAFIVGMVGVNQGVPNRKSYPQCIEAFQKFNKRHRDTYLYMHTDLDSGMGLKLKDLINFLKLDEKSYGTPNRYKSLLGYPETYLRDVYTAIDVFLTPNMGEGFGIPIIEAQASGKPIIGTRFSTIPELCFFGELIEGQPFYTNQSSFQCIPNVNTIVRALNKVYGYTTEHYKKESQKARQAIRQHYHPDKVTRQHWAPVLDKALKRIGKWDYKDIGILSLDDEKSVDDHK